MNEFETLLPQHIKDMFYNLFSDEISVNVFEEWLYDDEVIEQIIGPDRYLELILINYNNRGAKYELIPLIEKYIDMGEFESRKLIALLKKILMKPKEYPYLIMELYDLYCGGYFFLQKLGLEYGLCMYAPHGANSWEELSEAKQKALVDGFSPEIEKEIEQNIALLENKSIVLTGQKNELGQYCFIDYR